LKEKLEIRLKEPMLAKMYLKSTLNWLLQMRVLKTMKMTKMTKMRTTPMKTMKKENTTKTRMMKRVNMMMKKRSPIDLN
jgi:hypothetical protein